MTSYSAAGIFPDSSYEAAAKAGVLDPHHLAMVKIFLSKIKPMPAAFDRDTSRCWMESTSRGQEQIRNRPANQGRHRKIQNQARMFGMVMLWLRFDRIFLTQADVNPPPKNLRRP